MKERTLFSICIPAYNRVHYLSPLLDSILSQSFTDFEIVICEDKSPQRDQIAKLVRSYQSNTLRPIKYFENSTNLGFDGNIRKLVDRASGKFCFFMGNDDLLCDDALLEVARLIKCRDNLGMVLKSYAWFSGSPNNIEQTVRYFPLECEFSPGKNAIHTCFRRSGVISGYIINRDAAQLCATSKFDGSLFYQMHLTANVLASMSAVFTPKILVLCRNGEPPEFGHSGSEEGKYIPGSFTSQARLNMVDGALSIVRNLKETKGIDVVDLVISDYANYFYPCIRDQLNLSIYEYWKFYRSFGKMGFKKYPMFHLYFFIAYILGQKGFDWIVKLSYRILGRSLKFGKS